MRLLPEWEPVDAALIAWHPSYEDYFSELAATLHAHAPVHVISPDLDTSKSLGEEWAAAGIDTARLRFFEYEHEAFWSRDFGPWSVALPGGDLGFVDASYYPTRYRDDAIPTLLAPVFDVPVFRPELDAEGGNIMSNGAGLCVTTTAMPYHNPPLLSFELHAEHLVPWLGCERPIFLEPIKGERTGHVDLFSKLLSADTAVVGRFDPERDPENAARMDRNAARLEAVRLADGRPLRVFRIPMPSAKPLFPTYTNASFVNGSLLVPVYESTAEHEAEALEVYREALAPEISIVTVESESVAAVGGAVHCTTMELRFEREPTPADPADRPAKVELPKGAIGATVNAAIGHGESATATASFEDAGEDEADSGESADTAAPSEDGEESPRGKRRRILHRRLRDIGVSQQCLRHGQARKGLGKV